MPFFHFFFARLHVHIGYVTLIDLLRKQKAELAEERNLIFDRYFPEAVSPGSAAAFFRWLPLPKMGMDEMEIERRLRLQKVSVYCSYRFTVARLPYSFMRIAVSSPQTPEQLAKGCSVIRAFIRENQVALYET